MESKKQVRKAEEYKQMEDEYAQFMEQEQIIHKEPKNFSFISPD